MSRTTISGRIDWQSLRERIDLDAIATALMGPAPGRRGERGGRLWWRCPLGTHEDDNPSLGIDPGKARWRCFGCGEDGDAVDLTMRLLTLNFPQAIRWLADFAGGVTAPVTPRQCPRPATPPTRSAAGPEGMTGPEAAALVERAAARLWTPEGAAALDGLRARGLADETIRAARLGFDPAIGATTRDGRPYRVSGAVVPWVESGRLSLIKVRQRAGRRPKYAEIFRDRPGLYVAAPVRPGRPAIVTEGELDALIVAQALGSRAAVVTLGSASGRIDAGILRGLLAASPWVIATDSDDAGERAAAAWVKLAAARCRRARPPEKDWGETHAGGRNRLAYHLGRHLADGPSWELLAAERWAEPSDEDEPPGILAES